MYMYFGLIYNIILSSYHSVLVGTYGIRMGTPPATYGIQIEEGRCLGLGEPITVFLYRDEHIRA